MKRNILIIIGMGCAGVILVLWLILGYEGVKKREPLTLVEKNIHEEKVANQKGVAPQSLEVINNGLRSKDRSVKRECVKVVSRSGNPALIEMLRGIEDDDPEIRLYTAVGLSIMGDKSVTSFLKEVVKNGSFPQVLIAGVGLFALGDDDGKKVLSGFLSSPDAFVRMETAKVIGEILTGGEEIINLLLPLLHDEKDYVRVAAAGTLLNLGNTAGLQILIEGLKSPDSAVQYASAFPLAEAGYKEAYPFLKEQYLRYDDITIRARVGYYLALLGDSSGLGAVKEGLHSEDSATRFFSALALSRLVH